MKILFAEILRRIVSIECVKCEGRISDIEEWSRFIKIDCKYCGHREVINLFGGGKDEGV